MYYPNDIEDICLEPEHIDRVLAEIRANFPDYFQKYVETEAGEAPSSVSIEQLALTLGATAAPKKKPIDVKKHLTSITRTAIDKFEKDRKKYQDILDEESLEEYAYDAGSFKNTVLRNQCPIIHRTLHNVKAKELDRYRESFGICDPNQVFTVVSNLARFAREYAETKYDPSTFEQLAGYEELGFQELDTEQCTVYGVIGGGIKSHLIYKLYPHIFPYRSQEGVWSFWYLTDKKPLGCKQDSEFLMINQKDSTTQQNYFYPLYLFGFYSLQVYKLLQKEYAKAGAELPSEYRFVIVDSFLTYVASCHRDEIDILKRQIKEGKDEYYS